MIKLHDYHKDVIPYNKRYVLADIPTGEPHSIGQANMPFLAPIGAAIAAAAASASAFTVATIGFTLGEIAIGLTAVSAVTSIAGAVTGNSLLSEIGQWTGIAAGVTGGVSAIGSFAETGVAAAGNVAEQGITNAASDSIGNAGLESLSNNALSSATQSGLPSSFSSQVGAALPSSIGESAASAASPAVSSAVDNSLPTLGSFASQAEPSFINSGISNLGSDAANNITSSQQPEGLLKFNSSSNTATNAATNAADSNSSLLSNNGLNSLSNQQSSVGNITNISPSTDILKNGIQNFGTDNLIKNATNYSVDAAGNLTDITGKALGNIKDVGSDAWKFIKDNPSLTMGILNTGKDTIGSLLGQPGQEAQQQLIDAQNAQNKAQANALARQALWRKGVSGSSLLSYR